MPPTPVEPDPPAGDASWRPSQAQITAWTGDFLDALHGFARPTFMMPGMPEAEQETLVTRYPGSHLLFGWKTSYSRFPQWIYDLGHLDRFSLYERSIDRCFAAHKIPVVVIHFEADDSLGRHIDRITSWLERLMAQNRLVCLQWGWEINDINDWTADGDTQLEYLHQLRKVVGQNIPLYAHWTPERWSGWPSFHNTTGNESDEGGELEWLQTARHEVNLQGICYQDWPAKPVPEVLDRAFYYDKKNYIGPGICGRVQTADLDFVFAEHSRDPVHYQQIVEGIGRDGRSQGYC